MVMAYVMWILRSLVEFHKEHGKIATLNSSYAWNSRKVSLILAEIMQLSRFERRVRYDECTNQCGIHGS